MENGLYKIAQEIQHPMLRLQLKKSKLILYSFINPFCFFFQLKSQRRVLNLLLNYYTVHFLLNDFQKQHSIVILRFQIILVMRALCQLVIVLNFEDQYNNKDVLPVIIVPFFEENGIFMRGVVFY